MKAIFTHRSTRLLLCIAIILGGGLARAETPIQAIASIEPAATCVASSPLPSTPGAGSQVTSFSTVGSTSMAFMATLWRQPCATDSAQVYLYLRVTPTMGSPRICSSTALSIYPNSWSIDQGGKVFPFLTLTIAEHGPSYCSTISAPITLLLEEVKALPTGSSIPVFDPKLAFTLKYSEALYTTGAVAAGSLPDYVPAGAITPTLGLWWNPKESGSGYNIDVKHGTLVLLIYSYVPNGDALWYISSGPLVGNTFTGTLDKFRGGQCISCAYPGMPIAAGSDGTVTIQFQSASTAIMTLPGGRVVSIEAEQF